METHILRIPFESSTNGSSSSSKKTESKVTQDLLLSITSQQATSRGTLPDLTLQGTEGSIVVTGQIYSSRLIKTLAPDADISLQEFEQALGHILLQQPRSSIAERGDTKDPGITAVAAWTNDSGSSSRQTGIRLRFRRTIGGIVRYVGEIALRNDPDVEVDVLEWTRVAVSRSMQMETENARMQARLVEVEQGLARMRAQMDEFVRVKKEDEETLMGCFVKVLNEKKAKIREMQRAAGGSERPWPEVQEEEEDEVKEEDAASVIERRGGNRGRGRGRGATSQKGRKRKQDEVGTESSLALEDKQNGDIEMQQEDGAETDRESEQGLSDVAESDGDVDMSADSDDLDAPSQPQPADGKSGKNQTKSSKGKEVAKNAESEASSRKQIPSSKQHTLRARKPSPVSSENEGSTDDEL